MTNHNPVFPEPGRFAPFPYSEDFKNHILQMLKGWEGRADHEQWFQMAMTRVDFQRRNLLPTINRYLTLQGKEVLEIGCGTGPSSVVMAEQGARVTALDIDPQMVEATRLRARDHGLADAVRAVHVADSTNIYLSDEAFDLVVCNGVLEHVRPEIRAFLMREMWRVLRKGGHLFIGETPSRLCPIDRHTTELWWVHYLPAALARRYAVLRKRIRPQDDFQARGGLGCVRPLLTHALPRGEFKVLTYQKQYSWLGRHWAERHGLSKTVVLTCLMILESAILRPCLHMTIDDFLPFLSVCIEKIA